MSDLDFTKIEEGLADATLTPAEVSDMQKYETPLLNQRESSHGDYADTARIAGKLKTLLHQEMSRRAQRNQTMLSYKQLESLDLICTKIARVIAGDPNNLEHWEDIAGYARLIVEG